MFMPSRLSDNEILLPEDLAWAKSLSTDIQAAVDSRDKRIIDEGLDRAFSLADGNWDASRTDYFRLIANIDDEMKMVAHTGSGFVGCQLPTESDLGGQPEGGMLQMWRANLASASPKAVYRQRPICGLVGWWVDGILFNCYVHAYQERLSLLSCSGLIDFLESIPNPRILEIGGGFGAIASALLQSFPGCSYYICDLPESLLFSGWYLSLLGHRPVCVSTKLAQSEQVLLVPNYLFHFIEGRFDLVINTLSMAEMSGHQVDIYAAGISKLIGNTGKFFEQNQNNSHMNWSNGTHGISAPNYLAKHFVHRAEISAPFPVGNGQTNIWEN